MATSSIFENVKIRDPKTAESFVVALETSEQTGTKLTGSKVRARMATRRDIARLYGRKKDKQ